MKVFTLLSAFFCIFLFSCQKEATPNNTNVNNNGNGNGNGGNTPVDTSALGKFIDATGINDPILKENLDSLVTRAKRHGWWDLSNVIYPFAGGTQTSCKYNLKDPRDADAAFRLNFLGDTWTFTVNSANPGASGYANTFFNPATQIPNPNNCHLSVYSKDNVAGGVDNADIGAYDGASNLSFYLSTSTSWPDTTGKPYSQISNNSFQGTDVNAAGYYLLSKMDTSASFYRNSSLIGTFTTTPGNLPNLNLYICNQNFPFGGEPYPDGFSQRSLSFATVGSGISDAIASLMYDDISDFVNRK